MTQDQSETTVGMNGVGEPVIRYYAVTDPRLRPLVQSIWSFESPLASRLPGIIAPDSQVEFVLFLSGYGLLRVHGAGEGWSRAPAAFAYLQTKGCLEVRTSQDACFVAFRTNLATAHLLLEMQPIEVADRAFDLSLARWDSVDALLDGLRGARVADRGSIVARFVASKLFACDGSLIDTVRLYDWILANGRGVRIDDIALTLGFTRRSLERRFRSLGGGTPKSIANTGRFLFACDWLRSDPGRDVGDIAHELGFSDHAHFSHDFSDRARMTPSQFRLADKAHIVRLADVLAERG